MKTEIFGTFGPACKEKTVLQEMIAAGMTGMRLNLSHTTLAESADHIKSYQTAAKERNVIPQILIDMKGPELRVGTLKEPVLLTDFAFFCDETADLPVGENEVSVPVPKAVIDVLEIGDEVLLDDGKILLETVHTKEWDSNEDEVLVHEETTGSRVRARVLRGGVLQSAKSIKIKNKQVHLPPLTSHDIKNIKEAKAYGVTALMQPFVLCGEDLRYVRKVLKEHGAEDIRIFAKIENRQGVENLPDILPETDVIVIARGDLGNDMPLWELPGVQKQIEQACKEQGVPYVVVTQMLASMETNPVPTRAEVSDIYHAVYHGARGVMVTGETAVGKYPVETIVYLANTAKQAEHGNLAHVGRFGGEHGIFSNLS